MPKDQPTHLSVRRRWGSSFLKVLSRVSMFINTYLKAISTMYAIFITLRCLTFHISRKDVFKKSLYTDMYTRYSFKRLQYVLLPSQLSRAPSVYDLKLFVENFNYSYLGKFWSCDNGWDLNFSNYLVIVENTLFP